MRIFLYILLSINLFLVIYCDDTAQCKLTQSSPVNVKNIYINKYIILLAFSKSEKML